MQLAATSVVLLEHEHTDNNNDVVYLPMHLG